MTTYHYGDAVLLRKNDTPTVTLETYMYMYMYSEVVHNYDRTAKATMHKGIFEPVPSLTMKNSITIILDKEVLQ